MTSDVPKLVRGFAWFVFTDPGHGIEHAKGRPYSKAPGPALLRWVEGTEVGIRNPIWGETYLLVTEDLELPEVNLGWSVEPADLEDNFRTDDGEVRLLRTVHNRRTPWGIVQQCEFEVAQGTLEGPTHSTRDSGAAPGDCGRGSPPGPSQNSHDRLG